MNTWPMLLDEQTIEEDISPRSADDIQSHQYILQTALKTTIHMIGCYAEMAAGTDPQFQRVIALENYLARLWDKLDVYIYI